MFERMTLIVLTSTRFDSTIAQPLQSTAVKGSHLCMSLGYEGYGRQSVRLAIKRSRVLANKLLTTMSLHHQAVQLGTGLRVVMLHGWQATYARPWVLDLWRAVENRICQNMDTPTNPSPKSFGPATHLLKSRPDTWRMMAAVYHVAIQRTWPIALYRKRHLTGRPPA